jgi:hypothetical protein
MKMVLFGFKSCGQRYPSASDIFASNGNSGSHFWRSLHKIKHLFKLGASHVVVHERRTMFWLDHWNGTEPLRSRFPSLFEICEDSAISVA